MTRRKAEIPPIEQAGNAAPEWMQVKWYKVRFACFRIKKLVRTGSSQDPLKDAVRAADARGEDDKARGLPILCPQKEKGGTSDGKPVLARNLQDFREQLPRLELRGDSRIVHETGDRCIQGACEGNRNRPCYHDDDRSPPHQ